MNWELIICLTGIMLFAYWFTYIAGSALASKPTDVDPGAILFSFPYMLAILRLCRMGQWDEIADSQEQELAITRDPKTRHQLIKDHKLNTVIAGREFFTWERSLLCPICLHWWLTLVVGAVFISFDIMHARADLFLAAFVYLVNHLIIRKIS